MSDDLEFPRVIFPEWYDQRAEYEAALKGWLSQVIVESEDGSWYPASFIDPVRLQQDMEEYIKLRRPYFSEPGLNIVSEVTSDAVRHAVRDLWQRGYFNHLKPLVTPVPSEACSGGRKQTDVA